FDVPKVRQVMLAESVFMPCEQYVDSPPQQMAMPMLRLVREIMVDDWSLAEKMRTAVRAIGLAEKRTQDPPLAWVAWRDIQRGEDQLRRQLYRALRRCYIDYERFDEAMAVLAKAGHH